MNKQFGLNVYLLRKGKGLTQDKLAEVLNVSKMAVSKWERGLNFPDIEILCTMADYFAVPVDELLGRKECFKTLNNLYNSEKMKCVQMAERVIEHAKLAQQEGFLAVESEVEKGNDDTFFTFVVQTTMDCLSRDGYDIEKITQILNAYANQEENKTFAQICVRGFIMIIDGTYIEDIKEELAILLGKEYRHYIMGEVAVEDMVDFEELEKKTAKTDLLEMLVEMDKDTILGCLREMDNVTLGMALSGASGAVCVYVLRLLGKRLVRCVYEDICLYDSADIEEVYEAQKHMIALLGK